MNAGVDRDGDVELDFSPPVVIGRRDAVRDLERGAAGGARDASERDVGRLGHMAADAALEPIADVEEAAAGERELDRRVAVVGGVEAYLLDLNARAVDDQTCARSPRSNSTARQLEVGGGGAGADRSS